MKGHKNEWSLCFRLNHGGSDHRHAALRWSLALHVECRLEHSGLIRRGAYSTSSEALHILPGMT